MQYKVLITTAGVGSRLGELTKCTNKALVRVGQKPAISYVIESYPVEVTIVIALGYFGDQVRDFVTLAYPERTFEFVTVDPFQGPGSSLGYSMLQARSLLQCPFIYHAADTIVTDAVPPPAENWIGVSKGGDTAQYASWKVMGGGNLYFNDKGAIDFDFIHIGLVGIFDYVRYWQELEILYAQDPLDQTLNDCRVLEVLLREAVPFTLQPFVGWSDIGNPSALMNARATIADHFENLDKNNESVFLFKDFVIKFFFDEKIIEERVARGRSLGSLVPVIEGATKNFYRYKFVDGTNYADSATAANFSHFLAWADSSLWKPVHQVSDTEFKAVCHDFYLEKTKKRVSQFLDANNLKDTEHCINGEKVPTIEALLEAIDFDWLANAQQYQFHGDFILENIVKTDTGYCLIDWRHNFGGLLTAGDKYYDLAKLNHNLTVNHDIVNKNLFTVQLEGTNIVTCDIFRRNNLVECQEVLFHYASQAGYDVKKIKLLSGIIWLNMAPLHHHPFDQFLYYFGKLHIHQALKDLS